MSVESQPIPGIIAPIRSVHIENFRGIRELAVDLDPKVTVFFGENAAGKTSILDAIAIGLSEIVERSIDERPVSLDRSEIHRRWKVADQESPSTTEHGFSDQLDMFAPIPPEPKPARPVLVDELYARVRLDSASCSWDITTLRSPADPAQESSIGTESLYASIDPLIKSVKDGESEVSTDRQPFVLVAAYGTERAVAKVPERERDFKKAFPRLEALHESLCPKTNFKSMYEWFLAAKREEEDEQNQRQGFEYRHPALEWVRRAVERAEVRCKNPHITTKPIRMMVDFDLENGTSLPIDVASMSDGYRTHFALVVDIARRMVQLNPSDDLDSPNLGTNSEAIILIDEIDLHLHPTWQGRVIGGLRRAFPNAQFVLSTHSEQVIGSLMKSSVRRLVANDDHVVADTVPFAQGASGGRILTRLMGAPDRVPGEITEMLSRYMDEVGKGNGESEDAKNLRVELEAAIGGDERLRHADYEMQNRKIMRKIFGGKQ
ncbi:MAG: AAA family ATPase [Polyangiaceae bacterium]|nr:AAA family ATPase [Polyangiaceae bacterium]